MTIYNRILSFTCIVLFASIMFGFKYQDQTEKTIEEKQKSLEKSLVAPCCWNEAVETHNSGPAVEMRNKIAELLKEGKSEKEVTDYFISQYGQRILIEPTKEGFNLLVWTGPFIMLALGLVAVAIYLYRYRPGSNITEETAT